MKSEMRTAVDVLGLGSLAPWMSVRSLAWVSLLIASLVFSACKSDDEPSSSSTHWVRCTTDADCLRVGASACSDEQCVDFAGQAFEVEESGNIATTGAEVDPSCDPTGPVERDSELHDVLLVARADDGTTYVVDDVEDGGSYRVYRSDDDLLVPQDVVGSGESDSVTLTINDADALFTLFFEPRDEPARAMLFDGELEDDPSFDPRDLDADVGQELEVLEVSVAGEFEVLPLASATRIEYRAWSAQGDEMLVVRPDREFEYEYLRMFYSDEPGEPLIERRVTETVRAQDGGTTYIHFLLDGEPARAYFPVRFEDEQIIHDEPGTLTVADESIELLRAGDAPNELTELDYWCATDEHEGWRLLSDAPPNRTAGTPCSFSEECASGICFGAGCGPGEGTCVHDPNVCPSASGMVCGCDGVTREFGCDHRYRHTGPCEDADAPSETDGSGDERDADADAGAGVEASDDVDEDDVDETPGRTGTGVEARDLDGTWVFTHEEPRGGDAALGGVARIEDGCLLVGDAVVVWDATILDDIEKVVADVGSGVSVRLRFGGGGLSLDEGSTLDDFPIEVVERCDTRNLLYQGGAFERVE